MVPLTFYYTSRSFQIFSSSAASRTVSCKSVECSCSLLQNATSIFYFQPSFAVLVRVQAIIPRKFIAAREDRSLNYYDLHYSQGRFYKELVRRAELIFRLTVKLCSTRCGTAPAYIGHTMRDVIPLHSLHCLLFQSVKGPTANKVYSDLVGIINVAYIRCMLVCFVDWNLRVTGNLSVTRLITCNLSTKGEKLSVTLILQFLWYKRMYYNSSCSFWHLQLAN